MMKLTTCLVLFLFEGMALHVSIHCSQHPVCKFECCLRKKCLSFLYNICARGKCKLDKHYSKVMPFLLHFSLCSATSIIWCCIPLNLFRRWCWFLTNAHESLRKPFGTTIDQLLHNIFNKLHISTYFENILFYQILMI